MSPLLLPGAALVLLGGYAYTKHLGPFALAQAAGQPSPALAQGNPVSVATANRAMTAAVAQFAAGAGPNQTGGGPVNLAQLMMTLHPPSNAACLAALKQQQGVYSAQAAVNAGAGVDPVTDTASDVANMLGHAIGLVNSGQSCQDAMTHTIALANLASVASSSQGLGETTQHNNLVVQQLQSIQKSLPSG